MRKFLVSTFMAMLLLVAATGWASAGPIIIDGTDTDDHGFVNGFGNQSGWLYIQKGFENLLPQVTNGNTIAVALGATGSTGNFTALGGFNSGFDLAAKPAGWSRTNLTGATLTSFFDGTGAVNINNAGLIYMPTDGNNVSGGLSDADMAIINANAAAINTFVANGGGLFVHDQTFVTGGWEWLQTLLPGLTINTDNNPGGFSTSSNLTLTAAGMAAFPGLTDSVLSGATPWHSWFSGNFGGLQILFTETSSGDSRPVGLGGGAGTVIQPNALPEPATMAVFGLGALVAGGVYRRKRKALAA